MILNPYINLGVQVRSAVARARQGTEKLAELMGVLRRVRGQLFGMKIL